MEDQFQFGIQNSAKLPPDPRYRLVLRTRHGAPQPLTLSTASDPRASSPPTYFDKFTPMKMV